jgi:hypothetical protein
LEVLVDEEFWHKFNSMFWHIIGNGYIQNNKEGLMHRIVMNAKDNEIIDHINNKYNNRRSNLRIASSSLNSHNRTKKKNASSKYFGVSFSKKNKIWMSQIIYKGTHYYLGNFKDEIDAAKAYNKKALELYKEKANLNLFVAF